MTLVLFDDTSMDTLMIPSGSQLDVKKSDGTVRVRFHEAGGISVGGTVAPSGETVVVPVGRSYQGMNNDGINKVSLIGSNTSNQVVIAADGDSIKWGSAPVSVGGGATATLGTIGGSGPAAAAMRNWLRFIESDGTPSFLPTFR